MSHKYRIEYEQTCLSLKIATGLAKKYRRENNAEN